MSQILKKPYDYMSCGQQIRIAKIDNPGPDAKKKWEKFEVDGITLHLCHKPNPHQERLPIQRQPSNNSNNLSKEIASIKSQLLDLVSRLDRLEQELRTR